MRHIVAIILFALVVFSFLYQYKTRTYQSISTGSSAEQEGGNSNDQGDEKNTNSISANSKIIDETRSSQEPEKDLFSIKDSDIILGNPDAKVVVIEYSSLTCPHCAYYHQEVFPELKKKYIDTGKIAYVVREFISNKQDLDGAILARCFEDKSEHQKDPTKLLEVLYSQQSSWAFNKNYRELLENIGKLAGISPEKYNECLARNDWIQNMVNNSRSITFFKEFVGTPAFVINNTMYKGNYDVPNLSVAIDNAIVATATRTKGE